MLLVWPACFYIRFLQDETWTLQKHDYEKVKAFSEEITVPPLTAALLISRGFDTPEKAAKFLNPQFSDLHDPYLLKGMKEAVGRILKARENNEKVLIWGDYDVDGTTGTTLLTKTLAILGIESGFHIPNRFTEGYGINTPALEEAGPMGLRWPSASIAASAASSLSSGRKTTVLT